MEIIVGALRYERGTHLGAGEGMNSFVFRAKDPQLNREIAVKEIPKKKLVNRVSDFYQEAQLTNTAAHPNVVPLHYACETDGEVCIAMPLFDSGSLHGRLKIGPLGLAETVRVVDGVLAGVGAVHSQDLLHFDIKPTNVLFDANGNPMLSDFGQARQMTRDGVARIPPMYPAAVAPEIYEYGEGTVAADIYQAGVLLLRCLNGEVFYQEDKGNRTNQELRAAVQAGKFPTRRSFLPHVPRALRVLVGKAINVDPTKRYRSARDFRDALAGVRLPLDWITTTSGDGSYLWAATRGGRATLRVELVPDDTGCWNVSVHTVTSKATRAFRRKEYWATGLSRAEGLKQAAGVIRQLGELG